MALSKSYTLGEVVQFLRVLTGELSKDNIQDETIKRLIKKNTFEIVELLSDAQAPDYGVLESITDFENPTLNAQANVVYKDLSTYNINKIVKVLTLDFKNVYQTDPITFDRLDALPNYADSRYYYVFGNIIYIWRGNAVERTSTAFKIFYYRNPTMPVADADFIDMNDKYIPLLIDKCKLELYELAKQLPPKELRDTVEQKILAMREAERGQKNAGN